MHDHRRWSKKGLNVRAIQLIESDRVVKQMLFLVSLKFLDVLTHFQSACAQRHLDRSRKQQTVKKCLITQYVRSLDSAVRLEIDVHAGIHSTLTTSFILKKEDKFPV